VTAADPATGWWSRHLPTGLSLDSMDLGEGGSLTARWTSMWRGDPRRQVLFDEDHGWLTAEQLTERTAAVAGRLSALGLVAGDRLLLSAQSCSDLVVVYVAALRLGLVVVPVNTGYLEREVAHIVRDAQPAAAVVDDAARGAWVQAASDRRVPVLGTDVDLPGAEPPALDRAAPEDPALLVYTSGTTGAPKGAALSHRNLLASAHAVRLAWRWTADDVLVLSLPLFHLHGLGVGLHGSFTAGAAVVLRRGFQVEDMLDAAQRHAASMFFGVPTMYGRIAVSPRIGDLRRFRLCVSGSAPLPAALFEAVAEHGGQRLLERYGMTETVMNVSNPYDGDRRVGTVGLPLPGVDLALAEGTGEILVRGPNVFSGYWRRPDATTESFSDEWFRSGDVGRFDDVGYLRIIGRLKELIISGGYNVYPVEVEEVLRAHPAVEDVAVVGRPHPEWGEQVTAYLVGDPSAEAGILGFAAERLAAYKRPKQLRFVPELPRNALGKVVRNDLP
jgi:malonyl-CoA/methylmalonyl-CoA synthetase